MILSDFNGNGQIDPTDIAISLAISDEEENEEDEKNDDLQGSRT